MKRATSLRRTILRRPMRMVGRTPERASTYRNDFDTRNASAVSAIVSSTELFGVIVLCPRTVVGTVLVEAEFLVQIVHKVVAFGIVEFLRLRCVLLAFFG